MDFIGKGLDICRMILSLISTVHKSILEDHGFFQEARRNYCSSCGCLCPCFTSVYSSLISTFFPAKVAVAPSSSYLRIHTTTRVYHDQSRPPKPCFRIVRSQITIANSVAFVVCLSYDCSSSLFSLLHWVSQMFGRWCRRPPLVP